VTSRIGSTQFSTALLLVLATGCQCGPRVNVVRGELRLSPASLTLAAAPGTTTSQVITLTNGGTIAIPVSSARVEGDTRAAFTVSPSSLEVPAASSATLTVSYAPSAEGDDAARVVIDAEATNGSTFIVALLGAARVPDAGVPDSGVTDSGVPDSGLPDAGPVDAGLADAGAPDAGVPDAGVPDAGVPDAGAPDAGALDAGPVDAGPPSYAVTGEPGSLGLRFSSGGSFTVEGEVGLPAPRVISSGGTFSVEPLIPGGN
jgi:hypothetical protein